MGKSVLCDENKIMTESRKITNSSDRVEHNGFPDAKKELKEMKIRCPEKIITCYLSFSSIRN